ncbi:hypothetical protein JK359_03165 [Streptomyces actinomycinicus]|uniref:Uncharacterized protein n=1 Tax=Streptomyces actinomycinicus TaxID=1695166 RepID=A0A937JL52_9ACTN|nr:hypothetical protein [Streptomyces actinomycinicus]MBL1080981.1 hypothetical protein [Streptomyces actinomycinicus]
MEQTPRGVGRGRISGAFMVAGLIAAAGLLVYLGRADTIHALSYAGRLLGGFLVLAGLVAFTAAVCVVVDRFLGHGTKYTTAIILFGVLAVLGAGLMLLAIQLEEYTRWLWGWLGLIVWSGWALWELLHRRRAWRDITFRRNFAAIASVTALITVANFVYTQIYTPYASPLTVTLSTEIGHIRKEKNTTYVGVTFRLENTGKVAANIVGASYAVSGVNWNSTYQTPRNVKQWDEEVDTDGLTDLHTYADKPEPYTVSLGLLSAPFDSDLGPGQKYTQEKIIELPTNAYRAIWVQGEAYLLRKDRMLQSNPPAIYHSRMGKGEKAPEWVANYAHLPSDSAYIRYTVPVTYSNEILNLTRKRRNVTLWWMLGTENTSSLAPLVASLEPVGEERAEPSYSEWGQVLERYGFTYLASGATEAVL